REPEPLVCHRDAELVFEQSLDRADNLRHRVRPPVCYPVRLAVCGVDLLAKHQSLADAVYITHRATIQSAAYQRHPTLANHVKKQCLASRLIWTVKPTWSNNYRFKPASFTGFIHQVLRQLLALPVAHVRLTWSCLVQEMVVTWVESHGRVRRHVDESP